MLALAALLLLAFALFGFLDGAFLGPPTAARSFLGQAQLSRKQKQATTERQRGGVIGFLVSCWAELKKVQWPDRDTLVQATAVTILFVAVAGVYLGVLDTVFNLLVKQIL